MLDLITKVIKADVRLHGKEALKPDMAIVFVVNHFTRLETVLLPYKINQETGLESWSLASGNLFFGRLGWFLHSVGTVSTKDPDRDSIIAASLLRGENPWIIFPEGSMIKDKKLIDNLGQFKVYSQGERRPPHTGSAVLALRTEYYRQKIQCIAQNPRLKGSLSDVLQRFGLESYEQAMAHHTVIVPVNITYFPIRSRANILTRVARGLAKNLSERALEELSVEGTILAEESDVDIRLGEPIDVRSYLEGPGFEELMACSDDDLAKLEDDPRSIFNEAARSLMLRYMADIYKMTTINYDHVFATVLRHIKDRQFTERSYRNRIYLSSREIVGRDYHPIHSLMKAHYTEILFEDPCPKFKDFIELSEQEGVLRRRDGLFHKNFDIPEGHADFHMVRRKELTSVIANEMEPLTDAVTVMRDYARMRPKDLSKAVRDIFLEEDQRLFEEDYKKFHDLEQSKPIEVGRPFLLTPKKLKGGIVLVHGYLAAPLEVRAMAEYFYDRGYAVYGVRLKGHGTSPEDLAQTSWEDWYTTLNHGYAIVKSLTDDIILGGFSTGGTLALLAAARKGAHVRAVFSINAPQELRQYAAHLVPSVVAVSSLFDRVTRRKGEPQYVTNSPENRHINYAKNPMNAIRELNEVMGAMERSLKDVRIPTLVIQGSRDPVVDPSSGRFIFSQLGTPDKELIMLERDRHGIINGEGATDVFDRVDFFLNWAARRRPLEAVAPPRD